MTKKMAWEFCVTKTNCPARWQWQKQAEELGRLWKNFNETKDCGIQSNVIQIYHKLTLSQIADNRAYTLIFGGRCVISYIFIIHTYFLFYTNLLWIFYYALMEVHIWCNQLFQTFSETVGLFQLTVAHESKYMYTLFWFALKEEVLDSIFYLYVGNDIWL